ncbi:MAG TPA: DinB family protein [Chthonomonadaceae bacterium]|nr:DinB family protein [Chthonomonadaceae bacterium]
MRGETIAPEASLLLHALNEGYDKEAWHGPNLRDSIRGVNAKQAAWRPAPGQTNIWEYVVHAAYWKYRVYGWITGAKQEEFPREGSNWFVRPAAGMSDRAAAREWKNDITLLDEMHTKLRDSIARLAPEDLQKPIPGDRTLGGLIAGIALHDVYHAGQIQTLKQLYKKSQVV